MNNDVRQCKYCNRLFQYISNPHCPDCIHKLDDAEKKVRDFLYRSPGADVQQISEGTELEERLVLYLIKEGILTVNDGVNAPAGSGLKCSVCGRGIATGTICETCRAHLGKQLGSVTTNSPNDKQRGARTGDEKTKRPGMHIETRRY